MPEGAYGIVRFPNEDQVFANTGMSLWVIPKSSIGQTNFCALLNKLSRVKRGWDLTDRAKGDPITRHWEQVLR